MSLPTVTFDPTLTIVPQKSYARFVIDANVKSVTGVNTTDIFTSTAHGFVNGQVLLVAVLTGLTGLTTDTFYYVIAASADTFQLAATAGGTAINFTADGTATVTPVVDIVGKVADYAQTLSTVKRQVPDASGILRTDREVVVGQDESFKFEIEEIKWLASFFGSLSGLKSGRVQLWISDPDDAATKVAIKTNLFKCSAKLDSGINFQHSNISKASILFTAFEAVAATFDATA